MMGRRTSSEPPSRRAAKPPTAKQLDSRRSKRRNNQPTTNEQKAKDRPPRLFMMFFALLGCQRMDLTRVLIHHPRHRLTDYCTHAHTPGHATNRRRSIPVTDAAAAATPCCTGPRPARQRRPHARSVVHSIPSTGPAVTAAAAAAAAASSTCLLFADQSVIPFVRCACSFHACCEKRCR